MKVVVSRCLLGENCKYNGGNNYNQAVVDFLKDKKVIAVCPEMLAVNRAPRNPMEIVDGRLVDCEGNDVEDIMQKGISETLQMIDEDVELAVLKAKSPTCGNRQIYDGTFSHTVIDGAGKLSERLIERGIAVLNEEDVERMMNNA